MFEHASMNRIYRLVWSEVLGAWVAVAENARGRGKRGGRRALLAPAWAALGLGMGLAAHAAPPAPTQLPSGGKVAAGAVAIGQSGAGMTVTQGSARGVVDWQSFNVGGAARVEFRQPSRDAVTLNRVLGAQPSQIFGSISANGQVFLSNPGGVYFSPSATVDVGGLVATTHGISTADFMAGKSDFTRAGATGSVVNEGTLRAALGGYIALLAPQVRNGGVVVARAGTVALAAGEAFRLQFDGASSLAGVVNNSGSLEASGLVNDGGRVVLGASDRVSHTGTIRADAAAGAAGKGGSVILLADLANGASLTRVDGAISVRGGGEGGDGGFVDTSGSHLKIADGTRVDSRAAAGKGGKAGQWLLDPDGFTIAASGGDISGATLGANLGIADVAIASTSGSGSGGNIDVSDAVSWSANKLTLTATNDVNLKAVMTASGGASLDLEPGSGRVNASFGAGNTYAGKVNFSGGGVLTMNNHVYTVINSLGSGPTDVSLGTLQGAQASQNAYYALGSDIDASATAGWDAGGGQTGFTPFALASGAFDGLGHTISGMMLNRVQSNLAMIFTLAFNTGTILRNVGMVGGSVTGSQYATGLVGVNYGTVSNAFSTMAVSGFQYTGGLVGENRGGVLRNTYAQGTVSGTSYVGGLVGRSFSNGAISASYASGAVTGTTAFIGGLVGNNYFGTISQSYATGNVSGTQTVGGLVGYHQQGTISDTYALGTVSGSTNVGGLVGQNDSVIINSYAAGAVTGSEGAGGLVGLAGSSETTVTNSFWDTQSTGQAASAGGTGLSTAQMKTKATFTDATWDFATAPVWRIKSTVNGG